MSYNQSNVASNFLEIASAAVDHEMHVVSPIRLLLKTGLYIVLVCRAVQSFQDEAIGFHCPCQ